MRAFDGLRGLAVIAVVLFHSQLAGARGGFLGVSAFFTLSGYLITSLLLAEHAATGRVALGAFWSRRARRLLPAAYVAIAGVLLYGATVASGDQVRSLRGDAFAALGYVANWRFYFAGRSYEQLFSAPSPLLHFWSLAIEEQFYLLFPLLLLGLLRVTRGRRMLLGGVLAAGATASVVAGSVLTTAVSQTRVYYGTDTRAAELLIGALLAVVLSKRPAPATTPWTRASATLLGGAALATLITWWTSVGQTSSWLYHGGFALHAVLTAVVIAAARVDGPVAWMLSRRPLELLGRISYGVYLFHWPIFLWLTPDRTRLSTIPLLGLRLAITLVLATLSFRLLEQPVQHGARLRGRWPRVVAPATAAALAAALVTVTWSPPAPSIVLASLGNAESSLHIGPADRTAPVFVSPPKPPPPPKPHTAALYRKYAGKRPLRILVVGDSVGLTLGRGFELWAREHGDAQVLNAGHIYCPLGRSLPAYAGLAAESTQACDWTQTWQRDVRTFDPDVTILLFTVWEAAPRQLPGSSKWRSPGDPALDAWQLGEYTAAADTLGARHGTVVWMTAPCAEHIAVDKEHGLWYVNERTIPRLADARPFVHVLDLDNAVCPNGAFVRSFGGVRNARPDGAHFSDAGALAVAEWSMPMVLGQQPLPPYPRER